MLSCINSCTVDGGGAIEEEGVVDVTSTIGSFCEVDGDVLVMVTICRTEAQAAVLLVFATTWIDDKDWHSRVPYDNLLSLACDIVFLIIRCDNVDIRCIVEQTCKRVNDDKRKNETKS